MNRFIVISLFLLVSCNSPEPYSEKWFEKELADPNSKYSEEFEVLAKEMANDEELKEEKKYQLKQLLKVILRAIISMIFQRVNHIAILLKA